MNLIGWYLFELQEMPVNDGNRTLHFQPQLRTGCIVEVGDKRFYMWLDEYSMKAEVSEDEQDAAFLFSAPFNLFEFDLETFDEIALFWESDYRKRFEIEEAMNRDYRSLLMEVSALTGNWSEESKFRKLKV